MSDTVGDNIMADNANWTFAGEVADTFDSHVSKSVPFYHEGHALVAEIADFFLSNDSTCYDLGCSTGQLLGVLAERNRNKSARFVGVESQARMVDHAQRKCGPFPSVTILEQDILNVEMTNADLIVSYYALQFIRPRWRQEVVNRIYNALNWGGAFVLFEKVRAPDARFQDIMSAIYLDYKLDRGYGADEIVSKSRNLKGVLEPFSTQGNIGLLGRAGFVDVTTVFKYVCWEGFLAIK
jgi:tRNA (cmo5U34)-methyltransferase